MTKRNKPRKKSQRITAYIPSTLFKKLLIMEDRLELSRQELIQSSLAHIWTLYEEDLTKEVQSEHDSTDSHNRISALDEFDHEEACDEDQVRAENDATDLVGAALFKNERTGEGTEDVPRVLQQSFYPRD